MSRRRNRQQNKPDIPLVVIEKRGDKYRYLRYEGKKLTDKAESDEPIGAEYVELLRTNPRAILGDDEAPEAA